MKQISIAFVLVLFTCVSCSDDEATPTVDMGTDTQVTPDLGTDQSDPDLGPSTCQFQDDCTKGTFCHEGECLPAPACDDTGKWLGCVQALEPVDRELGIRAFCDGEFCRVACLKDDECADGQICTDFGECAVFRGNLDQPAPGGDARAALQAGVSNTLLNFPIGVSAAGYGSRSEISLNQYAELLYPSSGQMHGLFARAVALDNGEREMLLIRLPIVFPTAILHEEVARKLQEDTGRDWRDSLIISGTHTHSGPGRHWPLPTDTALPVGRLGTDTFSQQIHNWLVETTYQAAVEARSNKAPAKLGWQIIEAFDNDDLIASDRWSRTPPFDDNRVLFIRVDDMNDQPMAVLTSFGMHSTWFETVYMTGDSGGGIERGYERKLAEVYDKFVPVLFFNENGGTMSPRGGRHGHEESHKFEAIGEQFVTRTFDAFQTIQTSTDIELQGYTHRFPISYLDVGYQPGDWGTPGTRTVDNTYWHGGLNCVPGPDDTDFSTFSDPHAYFCLAVHIINKNRPVTFANRSMITALKIGDLSVITIPGENSMEVGYQVLKRLFDEESLDWQKAFVWGYAQDHQLYITPTNMRGEKPFFPGIVDAPDDYPDFAFSYLQGGYEPGLSMWGYKFGDYILDRAHEAFVAMRDGPPAERMLPLQMTPRPFEPFTIVDSDASQVGMAVQDMPAQVRRLEQIEFIWIGGDPGAEAPQAPLVTLEWDNNGTWEPAKSPSTRNYDNTEPLMLTRVREVNDAFEWVVYWEELPNFPAGTYRFHVSGHFQDGGERTPYELLSNSFEVVPIVDIEINDVVQGDPVTATIAYPGKPWLQFVGTDQDRGAVQGGYRMRHPRVPSGVADPVEDIDPAGITVRVLNGGGGVVGTYTGADITISTIMKNVGGRMIPATQIEAAVGNIPGGGSIEIDVVDQHGNRGTYP